jgi:hypothetical protein
VKKPVARRGPPANLVESHQIKKPASRTLGDLRPNATIKCLVCAEDKPQVGSTKFHAHHVCAPCTQKLQSKGDHHA